MAYKNIFLITIDCFRRDRCAFDSHDNPITPFLNELGKESIIFESAFATGPYTPESFPGMFAGVHANKAPYVEKLVCKAIPPDAPTIADQLRDCGYTTFATVTNPHLSQDRNFDKGFEHFQNIRLEDSATMVERRTDTSNSSLFKRLKEAFRERIKSQKRYPNLYTPVCIGYRLRQIFDWPTVDGIEVRQRLVAQLKDNEDIESPIFAWCHFNDAHAPIHPHTQPKVHNVGGTIRQLAADSARISGVYHQRCSDMYDNALHYVDNQIKHLFADLDEGGLLDDAAIIVVGDHGEGLGERGVYNHPWHYMYDELLQVPLLVWTSDQQSTERLSSPFSLAWLHEIVAELSGEEFEGFPSKCQGGVFNDVYHGPVVSDSVSKHGYSIAIRDENHKYVDYNISEVPYHTHKDTFESSRVRIDLSTSSEDDAGVTEAIDDQIVRLIESHSIEPMDVHKISERVDEEAEHRLQQLGYLDP